MNVDLSDAADGSPSVLEVLQWARLEKGCKWDDRTCGHLALLQWARANGCPWSARICVVAAAYGYLDILQWVRANGCPWDERTCLVAAAYGHLPALQWARRNGCPLGAWTCARMYNAAVAWGLNDVAAWLEANEAGRHLLPLWDDEGVPVASPVDIAKMVRRAEEEWIFFILEG